MPGPDAGDGSGAAGGEGSTPEGEAGEPAGTRSGGSSSTDDAVEGEFKEV